MLERSSFIWLNLSNNFTFKNWFLLFWYFLQLLLKWWLFLSPCQQKLVQDLSWTVETFFRFPCTFWKTITFPFHSIMLKTIYNFRIKYVFNNINLSLRNSWFFYHSNFWKFLWVRTSIGGDLFKVLIHLSNNIFKKIFWFYQN